VVKQQRRRKHSWNPYTSEVQRFSIYPQIVTSEDLVKEGDIITLSIREVDEKGRGIANYKGKTVIVYNASLGSTVKARVSKILGDVIYAEIVETLKESDVEY